MSVKTVDSEVIQAIKPKSVMVLIRDLAQQALTAGYLTIEAENQLRRMLTTTKYDLEDLNAFMNLQLAAMSGGVKQESREIKQFEIVGETVL